MTEIRIIEAENGFILDLEHVLEDGTKQIVHTLVEDYDSFESENDCMKRMLERVAEYFGCSYNKFSNNNLNITFDKKGHKVEDN